ncbi:MAG: hypothetical protein IPJ65_13520 [Archangiaceae bacterium]|nr:hypothetical protein [Archangiaceae bacterium]
MKSIVMLFAAVTMFSGCGMGAEAEGEVPDEAMMSVEVSSVDNALATETPCARGEVGDSRWRNDLTCCGVAPAIRTQRQRLQRCDGRYWRNTVSTRCGGACAR